MGLDELIEMIQVKFLRAIKLDVEGCNDLAFEISLYEP